MSSYYKVAFCGVGSIGNKHMHNLASVFKARGIQFQFDVIRSGIGRQLTESQAELITHQYTSSANVDDDYDIIFITNPTEQHYQSIKKYSGKTRHMFIEKPVFDTTDYSVESLNLYQHGVYYVACPLRYSGVIRYIKENVDYQKAYAVRSICSSYLPDWRKNVDYRKSYSAQKSMGGGVVIDLIHEWDYLIHLFGLPDKVHVISGKYSSLEIDSDDCAVYIAKSPERTYELHLDYFGRKSIRELQLFLENYTVVGDFLNNEIRVMSSKDTDVIHLGTEDMYIKELEHFLDIIDGKVSNDNDIMSALDTMRVAGGGR